MTQQSTEFNLQFPAVVAVMPKTDLKADANGRSKLDMKYMDDVLFTQDREACRCFMTADSFSCVEFNKVIQKGIGIVPGVSIPVSQRQEMGQPKHYFKYKDVINFKVSTKRWSDRFIVNTKGAYVIIMPIDYYSLLQASANKDLIQKCQMFYEAMGIKVQGGPSYTAKYGLAFGNYLKDEFSKLVQKGQMTWLKGFKDPVCPKHKKIGQYYPEAGQYYCQKCKQYIG